MADVVVVLADCEVMEMVSSGAECVVTEMRRNEMRKLCCSCVWTARQIDR